MATRHQVNAKTLEATSVNSYFKQIDTNRAVVPVSVGGASEPSRTVLDY